MSFLWAKYNQALTAQPLIVKAMTSIVGFTIGDVMTQKMVEGKETVDLARVARMASFGGLVHGTGGHFWYGFLDRTFPGTAVSTVVTKVGIDQGLFNPFFACVFFTYLGLAEGKSLGEIKTKIEQDIFTACTGSMAYWIPAHLVNFRFVPPEQRLLYINVMQIAWNMFLSFVGNKKVGETEAKGLKTEL